MKESELLGKLMPGHPDIFPIIENLREKYKISPIRPDDDPSEILFFLVRNAFNSLGLKDLKVRVAPD